MASVAFQLESRAVHNTRSQMLAGDAAAQTFIKLADVHIKLESKSEAASSWVEASKAYQKAGNPGAEHAQLLFLPRVERGRCQQ